MFQPRWFWSVPINYCEVMSLFELSEDQVVSLNTHWRIYDAFGTRIKSKRPLVSALLSRLKDNEKSPTLTLKRNDGLRLIISGQTAEGTYCAKSPTRITNNRELLCVSVWCNTDEVNIHSKDLECIRKDFDKARSFISLYWSKNKPNSEKITFFVNTAAVESYSAETTAEKKKVFKMLSDNLNMAFCYFLIEVDRVCPNILT